MEDKLTKLLGDFAKLNPNSKQVADFKTALKSLSEWVEEDYPNTGIIRVTKIIETLPQAVRNYVTDREKDVTTLEELISTLERCSEKFRVCPTASFWGCYGQRTGGFGS